MNEQQSEGKDFSPVDPLDRILAIEEIRMVKARYFRFLDLKDKDGLESLFTHDATLDMSEAAGGAVDRSAIVTGADKIVRFILAAVEDAKTVHQGYMPEISVIATDSATGTWAMHDQLQWSEEVAMPFHKLVGYGHYHDRYKRIAGRWCIQASKLTRLRVDVS